MLFLLCENSQAGTARVALRLGAKQADAKRSRDRQGAHSKAYILSNLPGFPTPSGVFTQTRQGAVFGLFQNLPVRALSDPRCLVHSPRAGCGRLRSHPVQHRTPTVREGILASTTLRFWIIFDGAVVLSLSHVARASPCAGMGDPEARRLGKSGVRKLRTNQTQAPARKNNDRFQACKTPARRRAIACTPSNGGNVFVA